MPIMKKFIKTPDINGIVPSGIDSGEGDNSVTLISSSAENSSASRGNQSTVSPARSSNAPKGNQSTVSPAKSSSVPRDNRSSSLRKAKLKKEAVNGSFEGAEKKEVIVLTETLTSQRPLRQKPVAKTMTIKEIQQRLNSLIKGDFPIRLIGLISANHETINKEINSGKNSEIIDLVDKAANVKATSQGKTAYQMAEDKDNKEFLEVKDNEEFLEVVDNARKRLAELKNRQSKSKLEKVDEVCKEPQIVPQSVAPQVTNLNRSDSRTLNDLTEENLTIEEIRLELERFIKNESSGDILNLISDNHEAIKKSDDTGLMELILHAADVKASSQGKTASEMAKEQNNLIFQEVVKNASDKLVELRKKDENFLTLTYFEETDEIYEEQEMRSVKSCSDLTTLGSTISVEESDKNKETLPDVTEKGGDHESIGILKYVSKSQENFLSWSDFDILPTNGNNIKTPTKSTLELSIDQDLHESDSDDSGMGGSPESSLKKKGMKSPQSSRRNSLSSSIESLNTILSNVEKISDAQTEEEKKSELPIPAPRPSLLGKELHQPNQGGDDSGIESPESNEGEPTLVVTPAPDAAKAQDQVTEEPKVIKPEEEKENTLRVKQKPAANRNSDKDISLKKQSNDRSFCFAATTISTLGAIACFATASIYIMSAKKANPVFSTSSIAVIGALFLIGIGFAATAGITWCLTPPPPLSELTSTDSTRQAAKSRE